MQHLANCNNPVREVKPHRVANAHVLHTNGNSLRQMSLSTCCHMTSWMHTIFTFATVWFFHFQQVLVRNYLIHPSTWIVLGFAVVFIPVRWSLKARPGWFPSIFGCKFMFRFNLTFAVLAVLHVVLHLCAVCFNFHFIYSSFEPRVLLERTRQKNRK